MNTAVSFVRGSFVTWASDRLDELVALVDDGVPGESLTPDELLSVWDGGAVLGQEDGTAAALVTVEPDALRVHLLVVHPGARRRGVGRSLLGHLEAVATGQGCRRLVVGGAFWPGVDVQAMTPLLGLLDAAGYRREPAVLGLALPASFRAAPPADVEVVRVLDDAESDSLLELDPDLEPRVAEHGTCFLARSRTGDGAALAFASHSVGRIGWLGPHAVRAGRDDPETLLAALAGELCRDLSIANRPELWIAAPEEVGPWVGMGAAVGRVFCPFSRRLA